VPSLQIAYVWHASKFTREVLNGLLRIGFEHHQQIIWDKGRTVLTRTLYWFQHEPCWFVRKKNAPWFGRAGDNSTIWASPSPKFIMGGSDEEKYDHPTQKPVELMRRWRTPGRGTMNCTLPPGNLGHRGPNPRGASRFGGTVPGTGRLVGGTASPEREEAVETVPGWPVCDRFVLVLLCYKLLIRIEITPVGGIVKLG
jgi:hypothetical protein